MRVVRWRSGLREVAVGFTLVELLVVIAILAILLALLVPVCGSVVRQARRTACAARSHDLGVAVNQYAKDFQGWLPYVKNDPPNITDDAVPLLGNNLKHLQHGRTLYYTQNSAYSDGPWCNLGRCYRVGLIDQPEQFFCPANSDVQQALESSFSSSESFELSSFPAPDERHSGVVVAVEAWYDYNMHQCGADIPGPYGQQHQTIRRHYKLRDLSTETALVNDPLDSHQAHRGWNVLRKDGSVIFREATEEFLDHIKPLDYTGKLEALETKP